ncbi:MULTISPECIES: sterol carrier family protein [Gardnerella]|uniref:Bacterial SCP orthologue domain-containing protein n=1 Tax=Gardnerella vaginalis TaxID=2702 RepID=A0A135Z5F3_GARVA|nr:MULTISPECIES: sterol carrier family protein [Gardnerella]KXI16896.1 hypothetical protein HMPREF3230_00815 [Gardnerella vaginalis]PNP88604.1 hypothetical protein BFS08_04440 [Gardnerella sp. KA00735]
MTVIREKDISRGKKSFKLWEDKAKSYMQTSSNLQSINSNAIGISKNDEAMAVRYSLYVLENNVPGGSVEVRVAPWGAVKILKGPISDPHNLTPPDVIELNPDVWLRLACGITFWEDEKEFGNISAVGERDNLSDFLPLDTGI